MGGPIPPVYSGDRSAPRVSSPEQSILCEDQLAYAPYLTSLTNGIKSFCAIAGPRNHRLPVSVTRANPYLFRIWILLDGVHVPDLTRLKIKGDLPCPAVVFAGIYTNVSLVFVLEIFSQEDRAVAQTDQAVITDPLSCEDTVMRQSQRFFEIFPTGRTIPHATSRHCASLSIKHWKKFHTFGHQCKATEYREIPKPEDRKTGRNMVLANKLTVAFPESIRHHSARCPQMSLCIMALYQKVFGSQTGESTCVIWLKRYLQGAAVVPMQGTQQIL